MQRQQLYGAGAVLAAAVAAYVYYGRVLLVRFADGPDWHTIAEGVMLGAAVLAAWTLARSRSAAAVGVAVALALGLLGAVGFDLGSVFFQTPVGWAVCLALGFRLALPTPRGAGDGVRDPTVG